MTNRAVIKVDGNIESALRKLKRKIVNQKLVEQLRERQSYEKPSVKRRKEILTAIEREKRSRQKEIDY
jgi:small subunit ribosomal protein S21